MEQWKAIDWTNGKYEVSNLGNVRRVGSDKNMSQRVGKRGYSRLNIDVSGKKRTVTVHRLVASAFIENPNNLPQVNHKDENKLNNSADNLEWCDQQYNRCYGTAIERGAANRKKPVNQFTIDGEFVCRHASQLDAGASIGVSPTCIGDCCLGKRKSSGGFLWSFV